MVPLRTLVVDEVVVNRSHETSLVRNCILSDGLSQLRVSLEQTYGELQLKRVSKLSPLCSVTFVNEVLVAKRNLTNCLAVYNNIVCEVVSSLLQLSIELVEEFLLSVVLRGKCATVACAVSLAVRH